MLPTIVLVQRKVNLHEGSPFGALRLSDEVHTRFLGSAVGLKRIALNAGANDVLPGSWSAAVARHDVVQIEIFAITGLTAVLAGVFVALENIVPCELNFLFGEMIVNEEQNHSGDAQPKADSPDGFRMRFLLGKVLPFGKVKRLERAVVPV